MNLSELQYRLGAANIAAEPHEVRLGRRDLGRMLVVNRKQKSQTHSYVSFLPQFLQEGDVVVLNDSKRIPGVLKTRTRLQNAQVELRFTQLDEQTKRVGLARAYPTHLLSTGTELISTSGHMLRITASQIGPHNLYRIESQTAIDEVLKSSGLPITSFFYTGYWDLEHYNNFYACKEGSVESPMAGLHFTPELLERIRFRGIRICFVTLHVIGSWLPPLGNDMSAHIMSEENFFIPEETSEAIYTAGASGGRVLAIGTTVVRTLESAAVDNGTVRSGTGKTSLCISPGYQFKAVDLYFTNFHPSGSSLILLDAAFCDRDLLLQSYESARDAGYLFFEFGDAVLYM